MLKQENVIKLIRANYISEDIKEYLDISYKIKALKERQDGFKVKIKDYMDDNNLNKLSIDGNHVKVSRLIRHTLDKKLLKQNGVDDKIIDMSTKKTEYTQMVIS